MSEETKAKMRRNGRTSPVWGRVLDGIRSAKDHPLLDALGIKEEKVTEYCPVTRKRHPIAFFYPASKNSEKVRRVCREAWDCRVTDPDTGKRVRASGNSKYDWLVQKELNLPYDEPETGDNPCLQL